jgi:hypothetical protein
MPTAAKYTVLIKATTGTFEVTALLGATPPQITDGTSIWNLIARPGKTALTQYMGKNPFEMSLPILFNGHHAKEEKNMESRIQQLIWMAGKDDTTGKPFTVMLYGALPFPHGGEWIITALSFGDNVIWNQQGDETPHRVRQDVTITLKQFIQPDKIELLVKNTGLAPKTPGRILVKKGVNLRNLATKYYGDYKLWYLIADANGLTDPKITKKRFIKIPPLN